MPDRRQRLVEIVGDVCLVLTAAQIETVELIDSEGTNETACIDPTQLAPELVLRDPRRCGIQLARSPCKLRQP
jgi:hypothetical protein